jgi:hypothetical protein
VWCVCGEVVRFVFVLRVMQLVLSCLTGSMYSHFLGLLGHSFSVDFYHIVSLISSGNVYIIDLRYYASYTPLPCRNSTRTYRNSFGGRLVLDDISGEYFRYPVHYPPQWPSTSGSLT